MNKHTRPEKSNFETVQNEVRFYRANEKSYGPLSNLFRRSITFEGATYPTAEHAYQAGKARTRAVREWLMAAPTPALLAMAAHGLYYWDITPDWSLKKFERMRNVLRAKFTQHSDLAELLLSTGHARLVETPTTDSPVNRTWGEVNGVGENRLGKLLMEIRGELRSSTSVTPDGFDSTRRLPGQRRGRGTQLARATEILGNSMQSSIS